jgi:uridine phosphorylase
MTKFRHPFDDRFYDDNVFLTADKCIGKRATLTKEYIEKHNARTLVLTFCKNVKEVLSQYGEVVELDYFNAGEDQHTIYALDNILFAVPFVGSACAVAIIDEAVALGINKVLACGSAGLIDDKFDEDKMFVITDAIRDEGASYHYAPAEVKAETSPRITAIIEEVFNEKNIAYEKGRVWTTDAFYRETEQLLGVRRSQGVVAVEMECSAFCIASKFNNVEFGQFLYFSDSVKGLDWQKTDHWGMDRTKMIMTDLAYHIAKRL